MSLRRVRTPRRAYPVIAALAASLLVVSTAVAHDFWLVPHLGAFTADSIAINGKSGTRFPDGSAVQPTRVAEAWLLSGSAKTKIADMSVQDGALRLTNRPAAGQYRVALALTPRTTRSTPAGLLRFLRAEGGAAEAARLERDNVLAGNDSVIFHGASYAATIVQVGRAGARGFAATAGFPLEFVPVSDPSALHVGDTLHVRILGGGRPAAGIGVDARTAADSAAAPAEGEGANPWTTVQADGNGVAHIPVAKAGLWLLRSAWVGRRTNGAPNEFDVARSTYVFSVMAHH